MGTARPSSGRKAGVLAAYAFIACGVYGYWSDFVPSASWNELGFWISLATGVIAMAAVFVGYKRGLNANTSHSRGFIVFAALVTASLMTWLGLVHGLGDLLTIAIGQHYEVTTFLKKEEHYTRRTCKFRLVGDAVESAFPPYLCLSENQFGSIPDEVKIKLEGSVTGLGFAIRHWTILKEQSGR